MSDIRCPMCPQTGDVCDHDQDERRLLCKTMNVREEPEPQIYDSTNIEQINKKRSKAKRAVMVAESDLRAVMQSPAGRRFMIRLLDRCGIYRRSFDLSRPEALTLAFLEGQRDVGMSLRNDIERVCQTEYLLMLKEQKGLDDAAA